MVIRDSKIGCVKEGLFFLGSLKCEGKTEKTSFDYHTSSFNAVSG